MIKKIISLGIAGIIGMSMATVSPVNAETDYRSVGRTVTPMNQVVLEPG